ncbi:MAG TPA: hypothetical protein VES66_05845 [Terriglobales bacterium]|nr:hypothetical protein [Terriglobales bacterium]
MGTNSVGTAVAPDGVASVPIQAPLAWSSWSRCQSSFSLALTPYLPGVFALAEEIVAADDSLPDARKRMLALLQVSATDDLAQALDRLFLPSSPLRARLESGRCFVRFAVVPDRAQREAVYVALLHWLAASSEVASGLGPDTITPEIEASADTQAQVPAPNRDIKESSLGPPPPLPAGF